MIFAHERVREFGKLEDIYYYNFDGQPYPPLWLYQYGRGVWRPGGNYHRDEGHRSFLVELVCEGDVRVVRGTSEQIVGPMEVYLLHRGEPHAYYTGPAGFVKKHFLGLEGVELDHIVELLGLRHVTRVALRRPAALVSRMKAIHAAILETESDETAQVHISGLIYELLLELASSAQKPFSPCVVQAIEVVQRNLDRPLGAEELAAAVGVSLSHLNRQFSKEVGTPPCRYHRAQRLQRGRSLLRYTDLCVKEVASRLGYGNALYFSAQYKAHFGVSPTFDRVAVPSETTGRISLQ